MPDPGPATSFLPALRYRWPLVRPLPRKIASCLGYMGRFVGSLQVPFAPRGTLCDFRVLVRCRANGSPNFVWVTSYQQ